ncbi:hypothetical protein [Azospirillum sp. B510]|nr:hypothetical protein [Azospirillum sp. B510]
MSALDLSPLIFSLSIIRRDYMMIFGIARSGLRSIRRRRAPSRQS